MIGQPEQAPPTEQETEQQQAAPSAEGSPESRAVEPPLTESPPEDVLQEAPMREPSEPQQPPPEIKNDADGIAPFVWQPGSLKLVLEQGHSIGKEFLLSDADMLVGRRDPDQDFIPDIDLFDQETANTRYISRRQARLFFHDGRLWLEDLDSSNGTAINNKLVAVHEPRLLNLGDKLLFGQSVLLRLKRSS